MYDWQYQRIMEQIGATQVICAINLIFTALLAIFGKRVK